MGEPLPYELYALRYATATRNPADRVAELDVHRLARSRVEVDEGRPVAAAEHLHLADVGLDVLLRQRRHQATCPGAEDR